MITRIMTSAEIVTGAVRDALARDDPALAGMWLILAVIPENQDG